MPGGDGTAENGRVDLLDGSGPGDPVVLDGGLATELERRGHDVAGALWSARLLRDDPRAVVDAHTAYLAAGARVLTTASYQASFEGFAAAGVDGDRAAALMQLSVELARTAIREAGLLGRAWVAASVGPYGAALADGSEYTGAYADELSVADLRRWHRRRLDVLVAAGPDLLACETVPALAEARALGEELARVAVPGWISLTTVTGDGGRVLTRRGEDAAPAFALGRGTGGPLAVGVNCAAPGELAAAVALAARESGGPVVAYPNSGETWHAATRSWRGDPHLRITDVHAWLDAGARLVGGCCRVGPEQVAAVRDAVSARPTPGPPRGPAAPAR